MTPIKVNSFSASSQKVHLFFFFFFFLYRVDFQLGKQESGGFLNVQAICKLQATDGLAWTMSDLAGNANKAATTASATTHTQGKPSFAKPHNWWLLHTHKNKKQKQKSLPYVYVVGLVVVGALLAFPAESTVRHAATLR